MNDLKSTLEELVGKLVPLNPGTDSPESTGEIRWDAAKGEVVVADGTSWRAIAWEASKAGRPDVDTSMSGSPEGFLPVYLHNGVMKITDTDGTVKVVRFSAPTLDGNIDTFNLKFGLSDVTEDSEDVAGWFS